MKNSVLAKTMENVQNNWHQMHQMTKEDIIWPLQLIINHENGFFDKLLVTELRKAKLQ